MKPTNLLSTCLILLLTACNLPLQPSAPIPTIQSAAIQTELPAAQATPPVEIPSPTPLPTDIPQEQPTSIPLSTLVSLSTSTSEESGKAPDYTLKTEIPVLQGSDDPRVKKFNEEVMQLIQAGIDQFRKELTQQPVMPISAGSFYKVSYEVISPAASSILSLQLKIDGMVDGAAHPYHITLSFNYDLEKGEQITLNQLFLHGVNPLKTIADYCKAELSKREIGFDGFGGGAEPTPENYSVWNLSSTGLVIVFNEYQVAPYAAGAQTVIIPFEALENMIDPAGALAQVRP